MKVLGIWDGHDSGAALVEDGAIISAINEERLTRRKLEIRFPARSIETLLRAGGLSSNDLDVVAFSTVDPSKTLTRWFPSLKERFYQVRRRKQAPGALTSLTRKAKYVLTELRPNSLSTRLSQMKVREELARAGIHPRELVAVDHHEAHAAAAAFTSGYEHCLVVTLDGIGDGLSGSVWRKEGTTLTPLRKIPGRGSLGLLYEYSTFLLNMRELEDEGKVMALAAYAHPSEYRINPLRELFSIRDGGLVPAFSTSRMFEALRQVHWSSSAEQFAYYVQQVFEQTLFSFFKNCRELFGESKVAYAGGAAANVKANMLIRESSGFESVWVYPHMGDGGLPAGAALSAFYRKNAGAESTRLISGQLGPLWSKADCAQALAAFPKLSFREPENLTGAVSDLLVAGSIVFWFQGRSEYGPRALGGRSILARPDSAAVRDKLNGELKRRVWFQPFCPSMLERDAASLLENYQNEREPFMTTAYRIKPEHRAGLAGVEHIDGTCRPQILPEDTNSIFADLLREMRKKTNCGALLNTSFNLHGEPLVCSPADALKTFCASGAQYLALGPYLVESVH